jgi:hypothetical protein
MAKPLLPLLTPVADVSFIASETWQSCLQGCPRKSLAFALLKEAAEVQNNVKQ